MKPGGPELDRTEVGEDLDKERESEGAEVRNLCGVIKGTSWNGSSWSWNATHLNLAFLVLSGKHLPTLAQL